MIKELMAILEGENDLISNLANMSAYINQKMDDINWVGFYLVKEGVLKLGPFQGKPACNNIPMGKGVCGTAWKNNEILVVKDVHEFPGHIACDANSRSEVVIPIHKDGNIIGVLDVDSPILDRFKRSDVDFLKDCLSVLFDMCNKC